MSRPSAIGDLLTDRFRSGDDGESLYASAVVAAVNQALRKRWPQRDARAASFSRGTAVVYVGHSAIAGLIKQNQTDILVESNQALQRRFPRLRQPVTNIVTRTTG